MERAPGELAVADFAPPRSAEASDFADRIRREVIVQHEVLVGEALQTVDHLLGVLGAERGRADRLRLAAGEERRAVRARQEADHALDRADRLVSRPSMRRPSFRIAPRTISASSFLTSFWAAIWCCGSASAMAALPCRGRRRASPDAQNFCVVL
jgi:hypothetical protein